MNKIKIVWLVNDFYINNFYSVYKEVEAHNYLFEMVVVATTHVGHDGLESISSKEIRKFLNLKGIKNIDCYDLDNKLLDIEELNPDYVFYLTPYNYYLPDEYNSELVKKYSKICIINYGADMIEYSGMYSIMLENNFWEDCYKFFCETTLFNKIDKYKDKFFPIGYLKLDDYLFYDHRLEFINKNKSKFKITWKPRWTLDEDSNFISYFEKMLMYIKVHDKIEFVIYLHPLIKYRIKVKGYEDFFKKEMKIGEKLKNLIIVDDSEFLDQVLSSDIFISEHSSTLLEFTITGNPIIYCESPVELNELGQKVVSNCYISKSIDETLNILDKLIDGKDPKKKKRISDKNSYFFKAPFNYTSAQYLLKLLLIDFINNNKSCVINDRNLKQENIILKQEKIIEDICQKEIITKIYNNISSQTF